MTAPRLVLPRRAHRNCVSDLSSPHGVGHNRVCVCLCPDCVQERAALDRGPVQPDLFASTLPPRTP